MGAGPTTLRERPGLMFEGALAGEDHGDGRGGLVAGLDGFPVSQGASGLDDGAGGGAAGRDTIARAGVMGYDLPRRGRWG